MSDETKKKTRGRGNAFDRAADAVLALDAGWWTAFAGSQVADFEISDPQIITLGDENTVIGGVVFDRRVILYKANGSDVEEEALITRPVMTKFSGLPIAVLEMLAKNILEQANAECRKANIDYVISEARAFDEEDERRELARELLGEDASEEDIGRYAEQLRMPAELLAGGEAAAKFFDESISTVRITGDEGEEQIADEPLPPPGRTALIAGEWDFYTPEEVADLGGPESDAAYAFRIVRLCEAIHAEPEIATQLGMHLGAVTREWEMWRENEEFIMAGRAHFAQQSRLARSRNEREWMTEVRRDLAEGRIGKNVAHYAREFKRKRRLLKPPSIDRIRNFVSDLRREPEEKRSSRAPGDRDTEA